MIITRDNGEIAEAQTPLIISASRSTDIPAFYADWFFDRLQKGYSAKLLHSELPEQHLLP